MQRKRILNKILRILLLVCTGFGLLLYLLGVFANVFGLLDMKAPLSKVEARIAPFGGFTDTLFHHPGYTVYAGIPGDSRTAVFYIHGSPGSLDAYLEFLHDPHLRAHCGQYTYDRTGYGDSRPLTALRTLHEHAGQLSALIHHVGAERNILVGHSFGSTIAAYLAATQPALADGMVLVSIPLDPALEPSSWWRPLLDLPVISLAVPHPLRISNHELAPVRDELIECLDIWDQIACPVTCIHGENDQLVPVENLDFIKKSLVNTRVKEIRIPKQGHFILWTRQNLISDENIALIQE